MRKKEIIRQSIDIITEYYAGNLQPYFDAIADDVLWIGPREGQVLQGKEAILSAWGSAEHDLRFSMGTIEAKSASTGTSNLEVLLEYQVYTHFPDGTTDRHHQRLHYSWGYRGFDEEGARIPKICMIHISNVAEGQEADAEDGPQVKIYATSLADSHRDAISLPVSYPGHSRIVRAKGGNELTYYFNAFSVLWIESADRGMHSIIHTLEGDRKSSERLRTLEERYPGLFLRAHASYLVNPLHARALRRFTLTMADGTTIPIPQKKYTAFKRQLESWKSA